MIGSCSANPASMRGFGRLNFDLQKIFQEIMSWGKKIEEYSDAYYDSLMPCLLIGAPFRFISVVTRILRAMFWRCFPNRIRCSSAAKVDVGTLPMNLHHVLQL
ncbi:hypothetical protein ISN44_As07g015650 [Arabidopsis suecica]|uniref:Uncharacterized protein n=1 Tax=Arabidopsis suecica TaxID=45249 RepID=A0A8T2BTF9_ARASU|nr:hypothetical protein ISN44_As07g015650 [Arabidopsis suecica]